MPCIVLYFGARDHEAAPFCFFNDRAHKLCLFITESEAYAEMRDRYLVYSCDVEERGLVVIKLRNSNRVRFFSLYLPGVTAFSRHLRVLQSCIRGLYDGRQLAIVSNAGERERRLTNAINLDACARLA